MAPYLSDCVNCWNVTFYKLFLFNLTEFDKILYLDADVGIMSGDGIDELLKDYPTPAAVPDSANLIELNGGVLLIAPDRQLFDALLTFLAKTRNSNTVKYFVNDPWNCEWREYVGDQGFINAFFNSKETGYGPFYPIHYHYGILTSNFNNQWQRYFLLHRPHVIKGVHFTVFKPWHVDGRNYLRKVVSTIVDVGNVPIYFTDEVMGRFFVRYWLDVQIALNKCGSWCLSHFIKPPLQIPNEVHTYLKYRPELFVKGEVRVGFHPADDTTNMILTAIHRRKKTTCKHFFFFCSQKYMATFILFVIQNTFFFYRSLEK
ncbi:hypothetical protein RFI_28825 [Reticulomyxa filosa]|uniref:Uncharacterized protein n=1 Tax=Reticulomyxa filosa TaxID=46433 RepID=X6M523_RETFI|nr:hypothetical protein RFI_28825 [Reticulomyxa filosa]|eukprot:ETO08562.1 hypothetical protein RFI_28825 [Reticulomyxa filosa]